MAAGCVALVPGAIVVGMAGGISAVTGAERPGMARRDQGCHSSGVITGVGGALEERPEERLGVSTLLGP